MCRWPTASLDRGRITARVPLAVQETVELAASLPGATLNQFIVQTALREAERVNLNPAVPPSE